MFNFNELQPGMCLRLTQIGVNHQESRTVMFEREEEGKKIFVSLHTWEECWTYASGTRTEVSLWRGNKAEEAFYGNEITMLSREEGNAFVRGERKRRREEIDRLKIDLDIYDQKSRAFLGEPAWTPQDVI